VVFLPVPGGRPSFSPSMDPPPPFFFYVFFFEIERVVLILQTEGDLRRASSLRNVLRFAVLGIVAPLNLFRRQLPLLILLGTSVEGR